MKHINFDKVVDRSLEIRSLYHQLEGDLHGRKWTVQEDALAFLTDAALIGRNIMAHEHIWPNEKADQELQHKIGECMWWLIVLADRLDMKSDVLIEKFLKKKEGSMK